MFLHLNSVDRPNVAILSTGLVCFWEAFVLVTSHNGSAERFPSASGFPRGEGESPAGAWAIPPEDWLRQFRNASLEKDYPRLSALLVYVLEKAGEGTDQHLLRSLKIGRMLGAVNRNETYWEGLHEQVKQIMYQLGLEREPEVPRKRKRKERRKGPRISTRRQHVEL
ncbi:Hypp3024 [Branchiostoma lanceolatum]|uniref:Hypp3024 protein n=1 Tax=Branchiostoma lanceolatum TaxID=7740 RepID=A0A8K0EV98_BRALA|nr:Hypp3024 [Branchiostoma lanceolatum]